MIFNTSKYYTLVWENKWKLYPFLAKHLIWNNQATAERNFKERVNMKFNDGELQYKNLKILEIDIDNPEKSRFITKRIK